MLNLRIGEGFAWWSDMTTTKGKPPARLRDSRKSTLIWSPILVSIPKKGQTAPRADATPCYRWYDPGGNWPRGMWRIWAINRNKNMWYAKILCVGESRGHNQVSFFFDSETEQNGLSKREKEESGWHKTKYKKARRLISDTLHKWMHEGGGDWWIVISL